MNICNVKCFANALPSFEVEFSGRERRERERRVRKRKKETEKGTRRRTSPFYAGFLSSVWSVVVAVLIRFEAAHSLAGSTIVKSIVYEIKSINKHREPTLTPAWSRPRASSVVGHVIYIIPAANNERVEVVLFFVFQK